MNNKETHQNDYASHELIDDEAENFAEDSQRLTDEYIKEQSERLSASLDNIGRNKKFEKEELSKRQLKKKKKYEKSLRNTKNIKTIDTRKGIIALISFFCILIVGAIVSHVYLETSKIGASKIFQSDNVGAFTTTIIGDTITSTASEQLQLSEFTRSSPLESSYRIYGDVIFYLKNDAQVLRIKTFSFKIKSHGSGTFAIAVTMYDATEGEHSVLYEQTNVGTMTYKNNQSRTFKFGNSKVFSDSNENSYIKIAVLQNSVASHNGKIAIYGLKLTK